MINRQIVNVMMKKQYISPSMEIEMAEPYLLQVASDPQVSIGDGTVPPGSVQSRSYKDFDEDDEEDF